MAGGFYIETLEGKPRTALSTHIYLAELPCEYILSCFALIGIFNFFDDDQLKFQFCHFSKSKMNWQIISVEP